MSRTTDIYVATCRLTLPGKARKVRGDAVGQNREDRNAEWLGGLHGDTFRQDCIRPQAQVGVLLRAAQRNDGAIVVA